MSTASLHFFEHYVLQTALQPYREAIKPAPSFHHRAEQWKSQKCLTLRSKRAASSCTEHTIASRTSYTVAILLLPLVANKAMVAKYSQNFLASPIHNVVRVISSGYCEIRTSFINIFLLYFPLSLVVPQKFFLADLFWLRIITKDPHIMLT